jgi:ubiquinone/menaquinone biosynthesis C-methylase UbiE
MMTPQEIKRKYEQGENITNLLRTEKGFDGNSDEIIEIAYDMQSGSYIAAMEKPAMAEYKKNYTLEISKVLLSLCRPSSILEAGVGEATTLSGVLQNMSAHVTCSSFGFDLSWSRVAYAKNWIKKNNLSNVTLCTGNLFHIPFADNSIDVVYTSHSIEPNGGSEEVIMKELYRVAKKFLVLLEPGYELATDEARQRMDYHRYCKNLKGTAIKLGYNVLKHELFPITVNPLNPTAITIIEKNHQVKESGYILACPKFKTPLKEIGNMFFSPEALVVYPIVGGIPCLRIENGIFSSKYEELMSA